MLLALRQQETEVTAVLFHGQLVAVPARLRYVRWAKALWMLALVSIATSWGGVGALLGLAYLVAYGAVEIRFHDRLALW